jgi:glycosyltransferase involved in cell wall biosynthesis
MPCRENIVSNLVTIVIPTYKRYAQLKRAVDSCLNQTYSNIEIIVVDDNYPETEERKATEEVIRLYNDKKIKYIQHEKKRNGSAARNTGLTNANGKYITFVDDDDILYPEKISKQAAVLDNSDIQIGGVTCGYEYLRKGIRCKPQYTVSSGNMQKALFLIEWGAGSSSDPLYKIEAMRQINGYDETFARLQDWEMLIRFFESYKMETIDEVLIAVDKDDRRNEYDIQRIIDMDRRYLAKYKDIINRYGSAYSTEVARTHHLFIASKAAKIGRPGIALNYIFRAGSLKQLTLKELSVFFVYLIYSVLPFKVFLPKAFGKIIERVKFKKI